MTDAVRHVEHDEVGLATELRTIASDLGCLRRAIIELAEQLVAPGPGLGTGNIGELSSTSTTPTIVTAADTGSPLPRCLARPGYLCSVCGTWGSGPGASRSRLGPSRAVTQSAPTPSPWLIPQTP